MARAEYQTSASMFPNQGAEATFACEKAMARGLADHWLPDDRLSRARAFCAHLVGAYWERRWEAASRQGFALTPAPCAPTALNEGEQALCSQLAVQLTRFSDAEAGYLVGTIYTVLLPPRIRTQLGAFYTPPCLVDRLLDRIGDAGFDWATGSALDPACGGGAFLAPLARRMASAMAPSEPNFVLSSLARRLSGFEIDPFAAWISQALLEIALMPLAWQAKKRVPFLVNSVNSLAHEPGRQFDLVVGNPPYGRTPLDARQRARFSRSLYGHANLYGVFTDLALSWTKPSGVFAYITPTSFLGGQYFKALRSTLATETMPFAFEFVSSREGVFDGVLQEALLTVFKKRPCNSQLSEVALLRATGLSSLETDGLGQVRLPAVASQVWLMPRRKEDRGLVARLLRMPTRLEDVGFRVSTGQLVWNRHKDQMRLADSSEIQTLPLVWAEAIRDQEFRHQYARVHHFPFIEVQKGQEWLITRTSCVLCQRTTSKEQERRLVAAVLPSSFLGEFGGAVVENHLNMVIPLATCRISPETLAVLLNSEAVDRAFRCISGSVAVSAFELNSIPLPSRDQLSELDAIVRGRASQRTIQETINEFYGL
jgi:adenine-specific DNA-methyltransferase